MGFPEVDYMIKAEYKIPNGKLVVAEMEIKKDKISDVKLTGDFFMHPEESIIDLEEYLEGTSIHNIENVIHNFFNENQIALFGVSETDFIHVLKLCLENEKSNNL